MSNKLNEQVQLQNQKLNNALVAKQDAELQKRNAEITIERCDREITEARSFLSAIQFVGNLPVDEPEPGQDGDKGEGGEKE